MVAMRLLKKKPTLPEGEKYILKVIPFQSVYFFSFSQQFEQNE